VVGPLYQHCRSLMERQRWLRDIHINTLFQCFSTFSVKRNLCSNFHCSRNRKPTSFWGESWGPKFQAEGWEQGKGSWGWASEPPPYQLGNLGAAGFGGAPTTNTFTESLENGSSGPDTTGGILIGSAESWLKNTALLYENIEATICHVSYSTIH